jgi:hypothetical protein
MGPYRVFGSATRVTARPHAAQLLAFIVVVLDGTDQKG